MLADTQTFMHDLQLYHVVSNPKASHKSIKLVQWWTFTTVPLTEFIIKAGRLNQGHLLYNQLECESPHEADDALIMKRVAWTYELILLEAVRCGVNRSIVMNEGITRMTVLIVKVLIRIKWLLKASTFWSKRRISIEVSRVSSVSLTTKLPSNWKH